MEIPPISPSPHGFYSEIPRDQMLPLDLQSHLTNMVNHLHLIESELDTPSIDAHKVAEDLEGYDHLHTDFLKELNRNSNRGFEKGVKDAFERAHNHFADELNDIVDSQGTSLRDTLLSYDPKKTFTFIQDLTHSSHGTDSLNKLKDLTKDFSNELISTFKIK